LETVLIVNRVYEKFGINLSRTDTAHIIGFVQVSYHGKDRLSAKGQSS